MSYRNSRDCSTARGRRPAELSSIANVKPHAATLVQRAPLVYPPPCLDHLQGGSKAMDAAIAKADALIDWALSLQDEGKFAEAEAKLDEAEAVLDLAEGR